MCLLQTHSNCLQREKQRTESLAEFHKHFKKVKDTYAADRHAQARMKQIVQRAFGEDVNPKPTPAYKWSNLQKYKSVDNLPAVPVSGGPTPIRTEHWKAIVVHLSTICKDDAEEIKLVRRFLGHLRF
jgi:hypothetical protein